MGWFRKSSPPKRKLVFESRPQGEILSTELQKYFWSSLFSDVTIRVDKREFKVHKIVLSSQSSYFSDLFSKPSNETTNDVVELDDDPLMVRSMILFMYGHRYGHNGFYLGGTDDTLNRYSGITHVKMYTLAKKYQANGLEKAAKGNFDTHLFRPNIPHNFASVIREVYALSLQMSIELRDTVVKAAFEKFGQFKDDGSLLEVFDDIKEFRIDLTEYRASGPTRVRFVCHYCYRIWELDRAVKNINTDCCDCDGYRNWVISKKLAAGYPYDD
ncbi:hypothetical protein FQN53_006926 [Emmonsiellopsis sp. PD_33]|nr:hypothetical protein FQN53_006926 [Emmonsiellopsis sp. PD_33]